MQERFFAPDELAAWVPSAVEEGKPFQVVFGCPWSRVRDEQHLAVAAFEWKGHGATLTLYYVGSGWSDIEGEGWVAWLPQVLNSHLLVSMVLPRFVYSDMRDVDGRDIDSDMDGQESCVDQ